MGRMRRWAALPAPHAVWCRTGITHDGQACLLLLRDQHVLLLAGLGGRPASAHSWCQGSALHQGAPCVCSEAQHVEIYPQMPNVQTNECPRRDQEGALALLTWPVVALQRAATAGM